MMETYSLQLIEAVGCSLFIGILSNTKSKEMIISSYGVKEQLNKALKDYFVAFYGSEQDFTVWFNAISQATEGGKMLSANKRSTDIINREYEVPEWFMYAVFVNL